MKSIINTPIKINNFEVKNRILMPPLVCFNWGNEDGIETVSRVDHYKKRSEGGTGLIVVEATSISKEGRIIDSQLGLWDDSQIKQFSNMAKACHEDDSVIIVQLVHAGSKAFGDVVYSSSSKDISNKTCLEMSPDHIEKIKTEFVEASVRAKKAGLDGVEIHGAHGYLLSQFTSKEANFRTDSYGGSLNNRLKLSIEIVKAVREAVGNDFIIGYRFGVNDPTLKEDIYFAKQLEALGVDILNVSSGIGWTELKAPEDFPYSNITYMGVALHKEVNIPVACVFGIKEAKDANYLLENNLVDMVAVGRGLLADPEWTNKAINNESIDVCYGCKPRCKYAVDGRNCPLYK